MTTGDLLPDNAQPCPDQTEKLATVAMLSTEERLELSQHISKCPACQAAYVAYTRLDAKLARLSESQDVPPIPQEWFQRYQAAIADSVSDAEHLHDVAGRKWQATGSPLIDPMPNAAAMKGMEERKHSSTGGHGETQRQNGAQLDRISVAQEQSPQASGQHQLRTRSKKVTNERNKRDEERIRQLEEEEQGHEHVAGALVRVGQALRELARADHSVGLDKEGDKTEEQAAAYINEAVDEYHEAARLRAEEARILKNTQ